MVTFIWIVVGWISGWFLLRGMVQLDNHSYSSTTSQPDAATLHSQLQNASKSDLPNLSIIIPARNEEKNIARLLASLAEQTLTPVEVIVANDDSQDNTGAVAMRMGAKVVKPGELPRGWLGKSWACWSGAQAAQGDILVFLDADTYLEPEGLYNIALSCLRTKGFISVQPYHQMKRWYEQMSAFFNVIVLAGVGRGTRAQSNERSEDPYRHTTKPTISGAFGPCIACSKLDYFQVGGHEAIRGRILENYALGLAFSKAGYVVRNYTGADTVNFRMYPDGFRSLIAGWSKSFASGASTTSWIRLMLVILWIAGAVSSVTQWIGIMSNFGPPTLIAGSVLYVLYAIQLYLLFCRSGSFRTLTALLFPLPLLVFIVIFVQSAIQTFFRRKVQWKGRSITTGKE
ncbi:glycosyltransferase family 2 protein [Paenibacillus pini]|uniref:4,4'-diaponeurosporenoate glycosyltransferase n=1 Tax=Paenibacillus pini JCM 16418 TaxID=1236976 RepID=W7YJ77_9BACL|nr:glycosyltransferase family A protein [Paenibacillus pini]GAF07648.1 4,4'-diaponeurosporenoate glycosyltransferase [Paenibacillus pini JCM 16418]